MDVESNTVDSNVIDIFYVNYMLISTYTMLSIVSETELLAY